MTRKLLTVDDFRDLSQEGDGIDGTVVRLAVADPVAATDGSRLVRFVFSDGTVDRAGDSVDPAGWQIANFMENPVALWAHDSSAPPIGRATNVGQVGNKLMGDIEFMPADISPFADSIYRMVQGGYIKAVSVGFVPLQWKFTQDKDRPFGIDFTKQELLEISVCPVPCNPNALQEAKSLGIDTEPLREWASQLLDERGCVIIPRHILEETFRQAKTPHRIRQSYLAAKAMPDWKCSASRDLPIDDADTWDGPAASKRMLDAAGFDGDSPDAAKAARGFLVHDAANPSLRGSYKLPFADIVGGELKAVSRGISAAKGRLNQTAAPDDVLKEASGVIDGYESRMNNKEFAAPIVKAGRKISAANAALLNKAMDYYQSAMGSHGDAMQCIKDVLGSSEPDEDDTPDATGDDSPQTIVVMPPKALTEAEERAARLAEVKALREAAKV